MLEDVKELLGIAEDDKTMDTRLNIIIAATTKRLKVLLGGLDVPDDLKYIVTDVSIMRFNRIGSEGLSSHSVEERAFLSQATILSRIWTIFNPT